MTEVLYKTKYNRGLRLLKENNITLAKAELEEALKICGDSYEAMNLLGLCLYRIGDFKKARMLFKRSIAINASSENRAQEYLHELEGEGFKEFLRLYNEGIGCLKKGEYKSCASLLKKPPVYDMKITSVYNILGLCSYAEGKRDEACRYWMKTLRLDRGNTSASSCLADCEPENIKTSLIKHLINRLLKRT